MSTGINISVKQKIQSMLGWNELQYTSFQYQQGIEYLHLYIPNDTESIMLLERSRFFWAWWIKRWDDRDIQFANTVKHTTPIQRQADYKEAHSPMQLCNRIYPNKIIWKQALKVTA